ncbi:MAG: hypothetical protein QGH11_09755 [Pirellulaceae bacterium]|jgi:hypothetical protein|nr:hypothetical protein [Pirellulaceae bacterium]
MVDLTTIPRYGEPLASLIVLDEAETLDAGAFQEGKREQLKGLTTELVFPGQTVVDQDAALCCISALWLLHHFLDESHHVSQAIDTPSGSFWHGIMHRREGDYSNAKYWFRRVGSHQVYESLASVPGEQFGQGRLTGSLPLAEGQWDPFRFVDMCEDVVVRGKGDRELCQILARLEWELLFKNCHDRAIGAA